MSESEGATILLPLTFVTHVGKLVFSPSDNDRRDSEAAVLGDLRSYLGVGISQAFTCPIGHLGCEDMDRSVAWGRAVGAGA